MSAPRFYQRDGLWHGDCPGCGEDMKPPTTVREKAAAWARSHAMRCGGRKR